MQNKGHPNKIRYILIIYILQNNDNPNVYYIIQNTGHPKTNDGKYKKKKKTTKNQNNKNLFMCIKHCCKNDQAKIKLEHRCFAITKFMKKIIKHRCNLPFFRVLLITFEVFDRFGSFSIPTGSLKFQTF